MGVCSSSSPGGPHIPGMLRKKGGSRKGTGSRRSCGKFSRISHKPLGLILLRCLIQREKAFPGSRGKRFPQIQREKAFPDQREKVFPVVGIPAGRRALIGMGGCASQKTPAVMPKESSRATSQILGVWLWGTGAEVGEGGGVGAGIAGNSTSWITLWDGFSASITIRIPNPPQNLP